MGKPGWNNRKSGGGFGRRLLRWTLWTLILFALVTALPVLAMRWWDPFGSAFMLQARIEAVGDKEPYRTRYDWVDMERISPEAALAVVASEDQLFPVHYGFDLKSIQKAMANNSEGKPIKGASTITQQVAKNLFLWSGRNFLRKGLEAWFTVLIEAMWPKRRILEVYLNIAEFGRGTYGVEAAARRYFNKPALRINTDEAALLAAVLPNPIRMRVDRPSNYVSSRQRWIMRQMRALGGRAYLRGLLTAHAGLSLRHSYSHFALRNR